MKRVICLAAFIALAVTAGAQTTTSVSLFFLGFGGTGNASSFSITGAGSMTPLGAPKLVVTGGTGSTFNFTFTFIPSGDTLNASCSNATHTTSTVAGTTSDNFSGTATVSGGTGAYVQASGSFTFSMSVTPATAQTNLSFSLSGSGSITTGGSSTGGGGGGGTGNQPSVANKGIFNAASDAYIGLPNSSIAQGSIFTLYGTNLGPSSSPGLSFPLKTTLGGVSVQVTSGGTTVNAIPMFVSATQISAVLPGNTPTGNATLTVSYNGQTSAPASFQIVASSFGIFAANQAGSGPGIITNASYQVLTLTSALHPNDVGIIWGTGIGASPGDDGSQPPPQTNLANINLSVYVGATQATVLYRGRSFFTGEDQINFTIPAGVFGCHVPIAVLIGTTVSNFVSMPIAPAGTNTCSDPTGPTGSQLGQFAANGTVRIGDVGLNRSTQTLTTTNGGTQTTTTDAGSGIFDKFNFQQLNVASNPFQTFTFGACVVYTFRGGSATTTDVIQPTYLDAGSAITVTGPNGTKQLPKVTSTVNGQTTISYYASLGSSASGQQLYLSPGSYTLSGPGGPDVGAFSQNLTVPVSLTWTNKDSVSTITRANGQLVTWTGGDPNSNVIIDGSSFVLGTALDGSDTVGAFFSCTAKQTDLQFTIPAVVLLSLPATQTVGGVLFSGALTVDNQITFPVTIPNVDYAFIGFSSSDTKSVNFQ